MAEPVRKDLKAAPQKEVISAPAPAQPTPPPDGAALDVFSAVAVATSSAAGGEPVRAGGEARGVPAITRDFTETVNPSQTKEPDSAFSSMIGREDLFGRVSPEVVGRELGIGEEAVSPEAFRSSGRDALEDQVNEAIPQDQPEAAGDRRGRLGTPEDLGVQGAFGTKADLAAGGSGMDLFNVSLPTGGASSARDDLAIMMGMVTAGSNTASAIPSVADDTIPDAPPVDDTAADPLLDQSAVGSPLAAPPTAPPITSLGGRSLVFGGAAGNQNFTTDEAADATGDLGSAIAKLIPGPVGQVANSFFVGWRAGRAIDNATGVGEKAVNAALPHTEAGKFEAEMNRKAAEAEAAAKARDAQKATTSSDTAPAPTISRPSGEGAPEVTPEYLAWRAAGRARHGLGQGGSGDIDPADQGGEAIPSVGPAAGPGLHLAVGMSEEATRNFLLGQPVDDSFGGGGGSFNFGNLPGDRGNIDYGPDSTGAWSNRTENEADALGPYRPGLGINDANSDSEEQDDDADDAT